MLCPNCSFQLKGDEKFCPRCAAEIIDTSDIPALKKETNSQVFRKSSVFAPEPVYVHSPEEKPSKRKGRKAAIALIMVFSLTAVIMVGLGLGEYYGIIPALAESSAYPQATENLLTTLRGEFTQDYGSVAPDISFSAVDCIVTGKEGLAVRKGPGEGYGQIAVLPIGSPLKVMGGTTAEENWVYIVCDTAEAEGWVLSSFLSDASAVSGSLPISATQAKAEDAVFTPYEAVVFAEKGLYLREGPGTQYGVVDIVGDGVRVTVMAEDTDWFFVKLGDLKGYMKGSYLKALEGQST